MLHRVALFAALLLPTAVFAQQTSAPATDEAAAPAAQNPHVRLQTNHGAIVLELYSDKAPKSAENFLTYVRDGHYDDTVFHRVIDNFMIQGGGFTTDLQQKPTRAPIENEAKNGLSNERGTISMARTNDPHSGTSQFFINVVDNPRLDFVSEQNGFTWGYAVFGRVVEGMDVVDRIRALETGPQGPFASNVPKEPAIIEKAEVVAAPANAAGQPPQAAETATEAADEAASGE